MVDCGYGGGGCDGTGTAGVVVEGSTVRRPVADVASTPGVAVEPCG